MPNKLCLRQHITILAVIHPRHLEDRSSVSKVSKKGEKRRQQCLACSSYCGLTYFTYRRRRELCRPVKFFRITSCEEECPLSCLKVDLPIQYSSKQQPIYQTLHQSAELLRLSYRHFAQIALPQFYIPQFLMLCTFFPSCQCYNQYLHCTLWPMTRGKRPVHKP